MTMPNNPAVPQPNSPPLPTDIVSSSFDNIPFSWMPGGPVEEVKDGLKHFTGTIIVYDASHRDMLQARYRPVTITSAGAGQNTYVDYWGSTDPSRKLYLRGVWVADKVILMTFRQSQNRFYYTYHYDNSDPENPVALEPLVTQIGVANCDVDFVVCDATAQGGGPSGPPDGGGGGTGGEGGGDGEGVPGSVPYTIMASNTNYTQHYDLYDPETETNSDPPTDPDWFTGDYDSGWWPSAAGAWEPTGSWLSGTEALWAQPGGAYETQMVLFRHEFDMPAGTPTFAELDIISDSPMTIWVNGTMVATTITPSDPGWAINVLSSLIEGTNLIGIEVFASNDRAYVSFKLVVVMGAPPAP